MQENLDRGFIMRIIKSSFRGSSYKIEFTEI